MKRFLFAAAVVALGASVGVAQDQPVAGPITFPPPRAPVFVGTAGVSAMESTPTTTQRRGLFSRLRNRNNNTSTYSASPVMAAPTFGATPMPTFGATPMPLIVAPQPMPIPMPMPGSGALTVPTAPGTIILAGGSVPGSIVMPADVMPGNVMMPVGTMPGGMVMTASYSEPTMSRAPVRRGLFGRLRNR